METPQRRRKIWILVANRERARLFEGEGRIREAVPIRTIHNPDESLKTRRSSSERDAHFATELAELLDDGSRQQRYDELVLVAARPFLGALENAMGPARTLVRAEYGHDLIPVDEPEMTRRVRELPEPG